MDHDWVGWLKLKRLLRLFLDRKGEVPIQHTMQM
jgi:hypothetical protein